MFSACSNPRINPAHIKPALFFVRVWCARHTSTSLCSPNLVCSSPSCASGPKEPRQFARTVNPAYIQHLLTSLRICDCARHTSTSLSLIPFNRRALAADEGPLNSGTRVTAARESSATATRFWAVFARASRVRLAHEAQLALFIRGQKLAVFIRVPSSPGGAVSLQSGRSDGLHSWRVHRMCMPNSLCLSAQFDVGSIHRFI